MDTMMAQWQEITSLGIVAVTFVLLVRTKFFPKKKAGKCDRCELAVTRSRR